MNTKTTKKTVNASANTPAIDSNTLYIEDAVVVYANPQTEKDIPDFRYIFAVKGNKRYSLLMHGAVRYGALVKSRQSRDIPYFEQVINGRKHWIVDVVPTAEELEAYNAAKVKPQPKKSARTAESLAFFSGIFGGAKQ